MIAVRRLISSLCLSLMATVALAQSTGTTAPRATNAVTADHQQQTTASRVTAPVAADTDKDLNDPRALKLSVESAIKGAVENNLGVSLQNYDLLMAGQSLRGTYGVFDFFTTGTLAYTSQKQATTNSFSPSSSTALVFDAGVTQNLPTGGFYDIGFNNTRGTQSGGGSTLSPYYASNVNFTFNQPLARNFGVDISRRNIFIARNSLGISQEAFRLVLLNTTASVEQAYYNLVYARQFVDVVKESLFLARDQSRITQIRIDVGASAPLDILQPRVQIATTEEQLISAVASVRQAEDQLRQLMNLPPGDWDRPIIPTDPITYAPITLDPEQSVSRSFELRPELRQADFSTDIRRINYLYARNQILPKIDLSLNYKPAGVAGRSPIFDASGKPTGQFSSTGYTTALQQIGRSDFPSWTVGVNFGLPILNIGARAEAKRAELDYKRSRVEKENTRENIAVQVRQAVRDVDTAAKQIAASRAAREAAEQNLDAERKRYENGMTTNFQVLQVQQQLSDARVREIQALVGYSSFVATYHRVVGDLLDIHSITVDTPKVDEPQMFTLFDRYATRYNWLNYGNRVKLEESPK